MGHASSPISGFLRTPNVRRSFSTIQKRRLFLTLGRTAGIQLEISDFGCYFSAMLRPANVPSVAELRKVLRPFCQKHRIRRLDIFGSAARGLAAVGSDVDLLVTLHELRPPATAELLEMAGEAEELVGAPVDFVLRRSLEKSANRFARDDILASAVCLYGA